MKIDAAIFDIGNVLLLFDYLKAANRLIEKNRPAIPPDREKIVAANRMFELGRSTRAEFLTAVRAEFCDSGDEEEFVHTWSNIFVENLPMTSLARRLSARMPVYLLSNIGEIHHGFIFQSFDVFSIFRDGVYSYRAGCMKPSAEIFEIATGQFSVTPASTLYFDDLPENCAAAEAAGFRAHYYEPHREDLPGAWNIPL